MATPVLFLLVGLPGTGKTTTARRLELERPALRLTKDEWVKALYGDANPSAETDVIEGRLIGIALRALQLGSDVVIDFGLWSRDERAALRQAAADLGAASQVLYLSAGPEEQRRRLARRQAEQPGTTWPITDEALANWASTFHTPTRGEIDGTEPIGPPPPGFPTWEDWRRHRWPPSV